MKQTNKTERVYQVYSFNVGIIETVANMFLNIISSIMGLALGVVATFAIACFVVYAMSTAIKIFLLSILIGAVYNFGTNIYESATAILFPKIDLQRPDKIIVGTAISDD